MSETILTLAIPNRNGARYLEHTLQSLARNRPYVKWWLQDSCSTDDSVEIARRYCGPLDTINIAQDRSQTEGLNIAMRRMGGDVIGFINSDDCLADGAAKAVLEAFLSQPSLDLVYGEVEWIDADGNSAGIHRGDIKDYTDVLNIYEVWWKQRQWVQPEVFWRRSLWDRVGPFDESLNLAFDFEYWVRCFQNDLKVRRIQQVLAKFRRHSSQKSTASLKAAEEIRTVVSHALDSSNQYIRPAERRSISNRLSYDLHQTREARDQDPRFWRALIDHPRWLSLPEVRSRLAESARSILRPR